MKAKSVRPPLFVLLCIATLAMQSCKDDNPSSEQEKPFALNPPTVFIPVGLLKLPQGIAVDGAGNVWVADSRNNKLKKFSSGAIQTDSLSFVLPPTKVSINKRNGDLLVVEAEKTVHQIVEATKSTISTTSLIPFSGDASSVFEVNTNTPRQLTPSIAKVGDIDSSPVGDVFVSAYGSPENLVVRIENGNVRAVAYSSLTPSNTIDIGARFLAIDPFGTLFTTFTFNATSGQNVVRAYSFTPTSATQSKILSESIVTGAAKGATMDAASRLYIAERATQELVIASTTSGRTIAVYRIPDTNGFSMIPQDVAVAADGAVYVVVTDRLGTDAGAVLKYTRQTQ